MTKPRRCRTKQQTNMRMIETECKITRYITFLQTFHSDQSN